MSSSSSSSCRIHIHAVPKDVLLRAIAPLLELNGIISAARSSLLLLQSLHEAELRHPVQLKPFVQHRSAECQPFLAALTEDEVDLLQKSHGWKIDAKARAAGTSSSSLPSHRAAHILAIGRMTSVRVGASKWTETPEFLFPHLHLLPRSVRTLTFKINSHEDILQRHFHQLRLPSHLTELHVCGAQLVPVEEIEKLQQLQILEIEMDRLIRGVPLSLPSKDTQFSYREFQPSPPRVFVTITFPSSLHTVIISQFCVDDWIVSARSSPVLPFVWPPALTSLELTSSVSCAAQVLNPQQLLRCYTIFNHLPETLTELKIRNAVVSAKIFSWMILQNCLPTALMSVHLAYSINASVVSQWLLESPRAVRTLDFSRSEWTTTKLVLPVMTGTGMSTLTSLTLPAGFREFPQLRELSSLTHLANLNGTSLAGITFPPLLECLEMGGGWMQTLTPETWQPPPALTSIYLGPSWSLPLTSLELPSTIRHIRFGGKFDHAPPVPYGWPPQLASLTFSSIRSEPLWQAYTKSVPTGCRVFVPSHIDSSWLVFQNRFVEWMEGHQCIFGRE